MKIRIISDLHLDVNQDNYTLPNKDVFTIIAGDTSGDFEITQQWIKNNLRQGIVIEGNHMLYNRETPTELSDLYSQYEQAFPINAGVSFLQNSYKVINDIIFVGATLWTDYRLYGNQVYAKKDAERLMNDFRWRKTIGGKSIKPEHCQAEFKKSLRFITETIEKFADKKCVVITHNAPSEKSIHDLYKNKAASESFASNLDDFILAHPNIALWCHGHVHHSVDYNIGTTRIYCNPRGYIPYGEGQDYNDIDTLEL